MVLSSGCPAGMLAGGDCWRSVLGGAVSYWRGEFSHVHMLHVQRSACHGGTVNRMAGGGRLMDGAPLVRRPSALS